MKKGISTIVTVVAMAAGMLAASPRAAHAQNVWVFNQMHTDLKPCFRVGGAPWTDFGGIAAGGQFAWSDFLNLTKAVFPNVDPNATEVLVRFTWAALPGGTCPDVSKEPNGKTVFTVDGKTPVYVLVGGSEEVRKVVPVKDGDHDGDGGGDRR